MVGSWLHCGYHLTTSIVAPALLSLPFAMGLLGWVGGVICLALAGLVAFYSYNLLSLVLEHNAKLGQRQLRFRDMARDILGGYIISNNSIISFTLLKELITSYEIYIYICIASYHNRRLRYSVIKQD